MEQNYVKYNSECHDLHMLRKVVVVWKRTIKKDAKEMALYHWQSASANIKLAKLKTQSDEPYFLAKVFLNKE